VNRGELACHRCRRRGTLGPSLADSSLTICSSRMRLVLVKDNQFWHFGHRFATFDVSYPAPTTVSHVRVVTLLTAHHKTSKR
jgi:hypothetical protein